MLAFRAVVSVLVSFVVRSFFTNSRPALRAAAAGGRPPARQPHAIRGCLEYDRTELNKGEDFPPLTDTCAPVGGSAGGELVQSGFRLARML